MNQFIKHLLQFGNLDQQQTALILKKTKEITLNNNAYFSEAGKVAKQFGLITEGIIRVCR